MPFRQMGHIQDEKQFSYRQLSPFDTYFTQHGDARYLFYVRFLCWTFTFKNAPLPSVVGMGRHCSCTFPSSIFSPPSSSLLWRILCRSQSTILVFFIRFVIPFAIQFEKSYALPFPEDDNLYDRRWAGYQLSRHKSTVPFEYVRKPDTCLNKD